MLGADVIVPKTIGFVRRILEHPLCLGAERNLDGGRNLFLKRRAPDDLLSQLCERDVRAREDPAREAFALSNQPQQQMLGLDRRVAQPAGLVTGEEQDPTCSFGVPLEHRISIVPIINEWPRSSPSSARRAIARSSETGPCAPFNGRATRSSRSTPMSVRSKV